MRPRRKDVEYIKVVEHREEICIAWMHGCINVQYVCIYPVVKGIISVDRLENNNFKDNVMELLGSLLSGKDCQVQKIRSGPRV